VSGPRIIRRHPRFERRLVQTFTVTTSLDGFRDSDYVNVGRGWNSCVYASSLRIASVGGAMARIASVTVRYANGMYDSRVPLSAGILAPGQSVIVDLPGMGANCVDSISIEGGARGRMSALVSISGLN
jgi:hypothetical protein